MKGGQTLGTIVKFAGKTTTLHFVLPKPEQRIIQCLETIGGKGARGKRTCWKVPKRKPSFPLAIFSGI